MLLTLADYALLTGIVGSALAPGLVILNAVRREVRLIAARFERLERRVDVIEKDKMDKRDWVRESLDLRESVAALSGQLNRMDGKMETAFGAARAIDRVADTLERMSGERARA